MGGSWSSANAINRVGQVAGTSTTAAGTFHAFSGNAAGISDLGTLGGRNSYGLGLNANGTVVGTAQNSAGYLRAFETTAAGLFDLGTLGGSSSVAYGINDRGQIVGYSSLSQQCGNDHAFLYSGGILLDLNNVLATGSGWTIDTAYSIDNSGDILAVGERCGQSYAVELNPLNATATPEPSVLALLGLGLGLVAIARIGKSRKSEQQQ